MIQYRVTIRDPCRNWRASISADDEINALKIALDRFRSERGYEPSNADDIFIAPDADYFLSQK